MSRLLRLSLSPRVWLAAQEAVQGNESDPSFSDSAWLHAPSLTSVRVVRAEVTADGLTDVDLVFPEEAVQAVLQGRTWRPQPVETQTAHVTVEDVGCAEQVGTLEYVGGFEEMDLRCHEEMPSSPLVSQGPTNACATCGGYEVDGFCSVCYLRSLSESLNAEETVENSEEPAKDLSFMELLTWAFQEE
ncbi:E1A [Murine adenovirus 3]|uniref:E1A n=1 Tax=Murine adenovirus 3 TaxID=573199 RepID=C3SAT2_9ADEN|nr:E1A [Murine adenovirus 3]ACJ14502.1 E1A [Murine adenovirus 3]